MLISKFFVIYGASKCVRFPFFFLPSVLIRVWFEAIYFCIIRIVVHGEVSNLSQLFTALLPI